MADETPKKTFTEAAHPQPSEHEDARHQAQIMQMQKAFADNLCEGFRTIVLQQSGMEDSRLETLTIGQMDELLDCLRATLTAPPPEDGKPFVAPRAPEEPTG